MARSVPEPTPSSNRTVALVIAAVLALLVAVAVFWFWPKATHVPETVAIATGLLDLGGPPDKQTIRQLVANVDRMPRDELGQLWRAVGEDWRRRRQEAIDRYFTASAADKPLLLDAEIKRLVTLRALMIALNPEADSDDPPWMPRERGPGRRGDNANDKPVDEAARKAAADRRAVATRYEEALVVHAKARGIALPTFR
jgi:hypothetical protein